MHISERTLLLSDSGRHENIITRNGLSLFFTIICIIDVFGVFPIVALPKAVIDCGFYGIFVVISVCSIQIFTATLLGKCWIIAERLYPNMQRKNRYPYSALAEVTYGKTFSKLVTFFVDITVFGAGIPNLILASQNLQLLGLRLSDESFNISYCYWIIILGSILCPILWIGGPKDMKLLCSISVCLVILVFSLVSVSIVTTTGIENDDITEPEQIKPLWGILLTTYGIITFQFDIHPAILTIQVDMKDKTKIGKAVISGFLVSLGMFITVATMAAVKYGTATQPSILETLPTSPALHLAAGLIAIQLCLTSAISNSALYQHMEDCMDIPREFNHRRCLLRTILIILAMFIAESVPRFDIVMSLIGGTLTGPLVYIFPPLIYLKMLSLQKKFDNELIMQSFSTSVLDEETLKKKINYIDNSFNNEYEESIDLGKIYDNSLVNIQCGFIIKISCISIILISIGLTITTSYFNVVNSIQYSNFSQPCIFNVTWALVIL